VLSANDKFEGMVDRVRQVGSLIDKSALANQLEMQLRQDWQRVRAPILARKTSAPRVLFILSHSPAQIMVGGRKTSADAMIAYAGARNAVDGFEGFKPLTPEAVIAAQPDIVLFTEQGMSVVGGIDGALKLPGLAQTSAGQKRRIVALEAMFMLGFGPRLPQALSALDQALRNVMQS
jgi:iron complex transport system substrate-binding protein